jgi:putative heme iron utilization protein
MAMDQERLVAIRTLLTSRKVLGLAAVIDGEPAASLLPYAVAQDFGAVYVQASQLARHTRALTSGARVSLLIHGLDTDDADPLQIERLTVQATVEPLERESEAFSRASEHFVARFPSAAVTLDFDDFGLFALRFHDGRYVAGFAQAFDVEPDDFAAIASLGPGSTASGS